MPETGTRRAWAVDRLRAGVARVRATAARVDPRLALAGVLVVAFALRIAWIDLPSGALIADETTYVNAARVIAGRPVPADHPFAGSPPGVDPQTDQPPLGKILIAGSMSLLGDNPLGWRLPSLVAGMLALVALAGIVRRAGGSGWLVVVAVVLFATDNLSFVHSRIATPDMPMVALALIGAWLALDRRWLLAGAVFGIAALVRPIALFGLLAVLATLAIRAWVARWGPGDERPSALRPADLAPAAGLVGVFIVVALVGLWGLDAVVVRGAEPFDHLLRIEAVGFAGPAGERAPEISSAVWL